jgi:glycosyltransferase involved in cell wall biosynthesis
MRLLMAATGPPSPGGKGYQVRLYNQILRLAERHSITLLTFIGSADVDAGIVAACRKVVAIRRSGREAVAAALVHSPSLPLSVGLYVDRRMAAGLSTEIKSGDYDLVQLQLVRLAPYLSETATLPTVLDLMDAAELNMRERARAAAPGVRQMLEVEARRLGAYERQAIAQADLSLLISRRDLAVLGDPPRARLQPNGIEPQSVEGDPPRREAATVIFTGTMSYFPNSDAAVWFATEIWPIVRAAIPSAVCRIVGRGPALAVRRLGALPGITVTGAVPQMAVELARASVAVAPVRLGSGMLTKVLEAMAVGTPVVATSKAFEGLPEDLHAFLHRADSPVAFANEVVRILNDPGPAQNLAADGLDAIRREHTWSRSVSNLEVLYEEAIAVPRPPDRQSR